MKHIANFAEKLNVFKQDIKHFTQYIKECRVAQKADWKESLANGGKFTRSHFTIFNMKWASIWSPDSLCCYPVTRTRLYYTSNTGELSYTYRHLHIAYSLLRGQTMKQIEPKVRINNEPDLKLVERIIEHYMGIPDFFKNLMDFRRQKPRVIKMYVLVREDMEPINRTVQAGHAVAEYLQTHKAEAQENEDADVTPWRNGYMIYLGVENEIELGKWEAKLQAAGKKFATFVEPDWGEPTKTALACVDFGEIFEKLPLMSLEGSLKDSENEVVVTDETVVR